MYRRLRQNFVRFAPFFLAFFLLFSCSAPWKRPRDLPVRPPFSVEEHYLRDQLYLQYQKWKNTPYREGGLSRKGIDCSGLVSIIYLETMKQQLPRTTSKMERLGTEVPTSSLRPGDLLFFRTGWRSRHVGIYLEKSRFLHASTTKGVIISSLGETYWKDTFYMAKRLDFR